MKKKKKTLRASFIVTFAASAAAGAATLGATGCGTVITNPPPCSEDECPDPTCPDTVPSLGSSCEGPLSCDYGSDECGSPITYTCNDAGVWAQELIGTCNPPPLFCPEEPPVADEPCEPGIGQCEYEMCGEIVTATCNGGTWAYSEIQICPPTEVVCPDAVPQTGAPCDGVGECAYLDECGQPITATCDDTSWTVQFEGTCNPPAPCEVLGQDGCALDPTCVWHEPGCGDPQSIPALPMAGCFSTTPCQTDADCLIGTCQQVMVLPECAPECNACGEAVFLCVQ